MVQVSLDEAKERLSDLIDAASQGETVLIEKEGKEGAQVVQLVVMSKPARRPKFGSAKGIILYMADDFDAPLEDFREYME